MGYRLWDKEKSKLAMAAEPAAQAMKAIGPERQVILLCDSWYPKAEVAALVERESGICPGYCAQKRERGPPFVLMRS